MRLSREPLERKRYGNVPGAGLRPSLQKLGSRVPRLVKFCAQIAGGLQSDPSESGDMRDALHVLRFSRESTCSALGTGTSQILSVRRMLEHQETS